MTVDSEIQMSCFAVEIKARTSSATPLPEGMQRLMLRTWELVDLLYWTPEPREGTTGARFIRAQSEVNRRNVPRAARPQTALVEMETDDAETEREHEGDDTIQGSSSSRTTKWDRAQIEWLLNTDAQTCKEWRTSVKKSRCSGTFQLLWSSRNAPKHLLFLQMHRVDAWIWYLLLFLLRLRLARY